MKRRRKIAEWYGTRDKEKAKVGATYEKGRGENGRGVRENMGKEGRGRE
jgi:hypothetical protein